MWTWPNARVEDESPSANIPKLRTRDLKVRQIIMLLVFLGCLKISDGLSGFILYDHCIISLIWIIFYGFTVVLSICTIFLFRRGYLTIKLLYVKEDDFSGLLSSLYFNLLVCQHTYRFVRCQKMQLRLLGILLFVRIGFQGHNINWLNFCCGFFETTRARPQLDLLTVHGRK